ncbi:MAG: FHA domain-containing protein [Methanomicrobiales archaeon]|nr:FHA domain-containing protein [Methanomicrobiales archaeon]MDI6876609.1 FHA domain-containing protein [Methanomicrobiales archaeon]
MDERSAAETVLIKEDPDFLEELSEYLDVLSSSARLRILKLLEKKPRDARSLSHEIETSYENTKKHLDKLLSIGVIRKEAGLGRPTSKGIHPVWEYSLVPGSLEAIVRNLGLFSNIRITAIDRDLTDRLRQVRGKVSDELMDRYPALMVMGGPEDGRIFRIRGDRVRIGRIDPEDPEKHEEDLVLPEEYRSVTRISKPHVRILQVQGTWYVEDCGSTGGTFLNNRKVEGGRRESLQDGDVLELSRGVQGVRLLLTLPADASKPGAAD